MREAVTLRYMDHCETAAAVRWFVVYLCTFVPSTKKKLTISRNNNTGQQPLPPLPAPPSTTRWQCWYGGSGGLGGGERWCGRGGGGLGGLLILSVDLGLDKYVAYLLFTLYYMSHHGYWLSDLMLCRIFLCLGSQMPWYFVNITARPDSSKTIQNHVGPQTHDAF